MDLILGIAWLATLGDVKVKWGMFTMTFMDQGQPIVVQGDPNLAKTMISPKALMKISDIEAVSVLWNAETEIGATDTRNSEVLADWEEQQLHHLLEEFARVFAVPNGLPPKREVDHRIPIKAGVDPINV